MGGGKLRRGKGGERRRREEERVREIEGSQKSLENLDQDSLDRRK